MMAEMARLAADKRPCLNRRGQLFFRCLLLQEELVVIEVKRREKDLKNLRKGEKIVLVYRIVSNPPHRMRDASQREKWASTPCFASAAASAWCMNSYFLLLRCVRQM